MGSVAEKPQVPQLDPNIQKLADQQLQDAQDFQANAGALAQSQGNMAADQAKTGLAQTNKGITANANSRGLLYSGLRQGALASAGQSMASALSQKQADINKGIQDQVSSMNNSALQAQMGAQNLANQRNALAYNIAKSS